jgi:uncharacterized membrane protein (Fun14 family)
LTLETVPSALFAAGSGGVVGFAIGYALKKVMKILVIIIGIFLGALMYLQTQQIIAINWDKLQSVSESTLLVISNALSNTEQISTIAANLGIPLAGGLSAGLVLGLSKG